MLLLILLTLNALNALAPSAAAAANATANIDTLEPLTLTDDNGNKVDADSNIVFGQSLAKSDNYKAGKDGESSMMSGISTFYDFSESFVETSMAGGFPFDLTKAVKEGDFASVKWQGILQDYLGFAVAVVLGVLLIIAVPIAGGCFCCCRCGGRCGGRRVFDKLEDAGYEDVCGRRTSLLVMFVPVIFAIAGTGLMFQANDNLSKAMHKVQHGELDKLDDVKVFLDNVIHQAHPAILGKYNFTVEVLKRDLDNIGYLLGQPVKNRILSGTGLDGVYEDILEIEEDAERLKNLLKDISTKRGDIVTETTKVKNEFAVSSLKSTLDKFMQQYSTFNAGQDFIDNMDAFDPSKIPDESTTIQSLDSDLSVDIGSKVNESKKALEEIPEKIRDETKNTRADVLNTLDTYSSDIRSAIDDLEKLKSDVLDGIDFDDLKKTGEDGLDTAIDYDNYRWYAGLALALLSLLIEIMLLLSLFLGWFRGSAETLPTERSNLSNCGGNMLFAATVLAFITAWLLMWPTTLLLLAGVPASTFVCGPVKDPSILDKLMNEYNLFGDSDGNGTWLGDQLFSGQGVDLEISQLMRDCENGGGMYQALKLENTDIIDLDELTDYRKSFDIDGELAKLSVDFSGTSVESTDLDSFLNNIKGLDSKIDFQTYKDELDINPAKLTDDFKQQLTDLAAQTTDPVQKTAAEGLIKEVVDFEGKTKGLRELVTQMNNGLDEMRDITGSQSSDSLENKCIALSDKLNNISANIAKEAEAAFTEGIRDYAGRVERVFDQFVDSLKNTITNDLGTCAPLWNIYNDLLVKDACTYILGSLNAWWCATGMTAVFLLLTTVASCGLSKHLYRMRESEWQGDDGVLPSAPPLESRSSNRSKGDASHIFNNKVYHADDPKTVPHGVVNGGYYY